MERMVGVVELESTTSTMSTWRSNQLSYTPSFQIENNIYYTINSRKVKKDFEKSGKKGHSASFPKKTENGKTERKTLPRYGYGKNDHHFPYFRDIRLTFLIIRYFVFLLNINLLCDCCSPENSKTQDNDFLFRKMI